MTADARGEAVLQASQARVVLSENVVGAAPARLINRAGRQCMPSRRLAKLDLLHTDAVDTAISTAGDASLMFSLRCQSRAAVVRAELRRESGESLTGCRSPGSGATY